MKADRIGQSNEVEKFNTAGGGEQEISGKKMACV